MVHDTFVDIESHSLLQSHPGVLKEQRVCSKNHSDPGDMAQLDY